MSLFCVRKDKMRRFPRRFATASAQKNNSTITIFQAWHPLQAHVPEADCRFNRFSRKEISPLISRAGMKASLTVEAALAMTLFLFAVMGMLGLFFVIRTEIRVQAALEQTGNQLASLPEEASLLTASLLFQERLAANGVDGGEIKGGRAGISLHWSTVMGNQPVIDLVAIYQMQLPFWPQEVSSLKIVQRSRKHSFGSSVFLEAEKDYVYITPRGEVYHESLYCTYIYPNPAEIPFSQIDQKRNKDGKRYAECSFCCTDRKLKVVWITDWGDRYHQSEFCRGVWHNVEQVTRDEVGDRRACSKCGKEES